GFTDGEGHHDERVAVDSAVGGMKNPIVACELERLHGFVVGYQSAAGVGETHAHRGTLAGCACEGWSCVVTGNSVHAIPREQRQAAPDFLFVGRMDVLG